MPSLRLCNKLQMAWMARGKNLIYIATAQDDEIGHDNTADHHRHLPKLAHPLTA
jgi:hypothetical protein